MDEPFRVEDFHEDLRALVRTHRQHLSALVAIGVLSDVILEQGKEITDEQKHREAGRGAARGRAE